MNIEKIKDVYGREVFVDYENKKVYSFENRKREIEYCSEIIEDGLRTGFYTNWKEKSILTNIESKLNTWNNRIRFAYAVYVDFNSSKNDKDNSIWNAVVEHVKKNENEFFTQSGDFRKKIKINIKEIKEGMQYDKHN